FIVGSQAVSCAERAERRGAGSRTGMSAACQPEVREVGPEYSKRALTVGRHLALVQPGFSECSAAVQGCSGSLYSDIYKETALMQNILKALTVGTAIALASVPAFAQDSFVGLTWGETSNNMDRSGSLTGNPLARSLDNTI